jgi:hypothetical protein
MEIVVVKTRGARNVEIYQFLFGCFFSSGNSHSIITNDGAILLRRFRIRLCLIVTNNADVMFDYIYNKTME